MSRAASDVDGMEIGSQQSSKKLRMRSTSRSKSRAPEVTPGEEFRDSEQKKNAIKKAKDSTRNRNKEARRGGADRVFPMLKPKHLFSGKRSIGKTSRR
ncbi:unnamed protein product [Urochloa humidicola]